MQIDLQTLVGRNILVLAGMERGVAARGEFGLDRLDVGEDEVVITAPDTLDAIAPSFVQGFLSKSYSALGEDGLKSKYRLNMSEDLLDDILEGIKRLRMKRSIAGHTGG